MVQQEFTSDEAYGSATEGEHQLCEQDQPNKANVLPSYASIYDGLCKEREE